MTPAVSAIVLNYRTPQEAWKCVEALLRQTIVSDLEVLVVDNHSEDDSVGFLRNRYRHHSQVRILETNRNRGYGQGNALGIAQARGEFLLIINPDNELEPSALETMVAAMRGDLSIGILAPKLVYDDGTVRDSPRSFPTVGDVFIKRTILRRLFPRRLEQYLGRGDDQNRVRDVDWVAGACFLIRRGLERQLGGFDPRYFLFFEDTDLCRRCWKSGKRVVYFPLSQAADRKKRLSEGGVFSLLWNRPARHHLMSAVRYFWKWRT